MKSQKGFGIFPALIVILWIVAAVGWICNIVKLIFAVQAVETLGQIAPFEILRIVGIFLVPLGAILGFF